MSEVSFNHQYEVFPPLSYEDFKNFDLFDLLVSIRYHKKANWEKFSIIEKYYHCAKQCFKKRYCKCGGNSIDAFKFIKELKTYLVVK